MRLEALPAADMLDVLHYYFEDDSLGDEEHQKQKISMRRQIYTSLYKRKYDWLQEGHQQEFGTQEVGGTGLPADKPLVHKPYTPPTRFDPTSARPYGTILDAPLG